MKTSSFSLRGPCVLAMLLAAANLHATTHYVDANSANPVSPFTNWATAAIVIQDAVDAAGPGDEIVVTNGVYSTGGRKAVASGTTNRVAVDKPLTIRSANGPKVTIIQGFKVPGAYLGVGLGAIRCVYLAEGAVLNGFTLTNGATQGGGGGGICCVSTNATVTNCVITSNAADGGGGAFGGTLRNCYLSGNQADGGGGAENSVLFDCSLNGNSAGGAPGGGAAYCTLFKCIVTSNANFFACGAYSSTLYNCEVTGHPGGAVLDSTLYNCTLTGNFYGASAGCKLYNCILYYNTASGGLNYSSGGVTLNYCCTTPMPSSGVGNITNAPLFADQATGDFHLQSGSLCINAGNNAFVAGTTDLDGNPRIVGATVDLGASEYQSPASTISYAWLQQYGLPTDGSADNTDLDGDRHNNWQEWKAGTIPTNKLSVLRMLNPITNAFGLSVSWQSVTDRTYFLERATSLGSSPAFLPLRSNLTGQAGTTIFTDTNAVGAGPFFYRVGVQE